MEYAECEFIENMGGKRVHVIYFAPVEFDGGYHAMSDEYAFQFNPEGVESMADWIHAAARWNATITPVILRAEDEPRKSQ